MNLFFICYTLTRRSSALIKFQPLSTKTSSLVIPAFEIFRQVQGLRKFSPSEVFVKFPETVGKVGKFIGCDYENIAANVVVKCSVE